MQKYFYGLLATTPILLGNSAVGLPYNRELVTVFGGALLLVIIFVVLFFGLRKGDD